jgi:hypothetical protein
MNTETADMQVLNVVIPETLVNSRGDRQSHT